MKKYFFITLALALTLIFKNTVLGQGCMSHGSGEHKEHSQNKEHSQHRQSSLDGGIQSPVKKISVDGYNLIFCVQDKEEFTSLLKENDPEKAEGEMEMQGKNTSHHLSVLIEDQETQEKLNTLFMEVKIINPKGKKETKMTMWMGDHYCNYYELKEKGEYTIVAVFKVDGEKHSAGFDFEINEKTKN